MAQITVFSTGWCGYCHRLRAQLKRSGIDFDEVDIEADPDGEELVTFVNGGYATVPTVLFADGGTLTNPRSTRSNSGWRSWAELVPGAETGHEQNCRFPPLWWFSP
ncbi:MAG: hypothetical protein IPL43_05425 [Micropruina sp.]|nr:hypothetical protein [Micropruina sp.]